MRRGGEILRTEVVPDLVEGKEYSFSDRGGIAMKGFERLVRLFEFGWQSSTRQLDGAERSHVAAEVSRSPAHSKDVRQNALNTRPRPTRFRTIPTEA